MKKNANYEACEFTAFMLAAAPSDAAVVVSCELRYGWLVLFDTKMSQRR